MANETKGGPPQLDTTRLHIQKTGIQFWVDAGKRATIEAITGIGKNFIFIGALLTCPKGIKVLFLAEQTDRERDVRADIAKYAELFGENVLELYDITFMTYQSAYKLSGTDWDFVAADEIHDSLSPAYSKFYFNNTFKYIIGLSATIIRNTTYEADGVEYTKGDLLDSIAPVCYKYSMDDGQRDGTARKLDVTVIEGHLDSVYKTMKAGSAKKPFYQTEFANYNYWDEQFRKALFIQDEDLKLFKIRVTSAARAKVLYKLPSKLQALGKLLPTLKGKTLIFGNDLDTLLSITPNVICSRYSDAENTKIRDDFEAGRIKLIGSFKKLKQGANLSALDNIVIISYYSTSKDLIQRLGRLRKDGAKIGKVYIFVTLGTQEEVWFNKMFEEITSLEVRTIRL